MLNYKAYQDEIFHFLRSLTIKNEEFVEKSRKDYAISLNREAHTISDYEIPYYQRMCGIRTVVNERMEVQLGQLFKEFMVDTLQRNPTYRVAMALPSKAFFQMEEKYASQRDLVLAVVHPITVTAEELKKLPPIPYKQLTDTATGSTRHIVDGYLDLFTLTTSSTSVSPPALVRDLEVLPNNPSNTPYPIGTTTLKVRHVSGLLKEDESLDEFVFLQANYAIQANTCIVSVNREANTITIDKPTINTIVSTFHKPYPLRSFVRNAYEIAIGNLKRLHKVICATNLTLLAYSDHVLEPWEKTSILTAINVKLKYFHDRWHIPEFHREDLYGQISWCVLAGALYQTIMAERVKNIRTPAVHSYHIWEYLRSYGMEQFSNILNREQELFLYFNLHWLFMNKGKMRTLQVISDKLLEPNGIEIMSRTLVTSTQNTATTCVKTPRFITSSLGTDKAPQQFFDLKSESLPVVLDREFASALEPLDKDDSILGVQQRRLETTPETTYNTKLLEFTNIPQYGGYQALFIEFILSSFIHEWHSGRIGGIVESFHPSYMTTSAQLTVDDMVYMMAYIGLRVHGIDPLELPLPRRFSCSHATRTSVELPIRVDNGCTVERDSQVISIPALSTTISVIGSHAAGATTLLLDNVSELERGDEICELAGVIPEYTKILEVNPNNNTILLANALTDTLDGSVVPVALNVCLPITDLCLGREVSGLYIPEGAIIVAILDYGRREETPKIAISHPVEMTNPTAEIEVTFGNIAPISRSNMTDKFTWFDCYTDSENNYIAYPAVAKYSSYIKLDDEIDGFFVPYEHNENTPVYLGTNRAEYDEIFDHSYPNMDRFMAEIDRRFKSFYFLSLEARGQSDPRAYDAVYDAYNKHIRLNYKFTKEPGVGLRTFGDWLSGNEHIQVILHEHEESVGNDDATWVGLLEQFFKKVVPIWNSQWISNSRLSGNEYDLMVKLVTTVCSYNVVFLKQNSQPTAFWRELAYVGMKSIRSTIGLKAFVPLELSCGTSNIKIKKESRVAAVAPMTAYTVESRYSADGIDPTQDVVKTMSQPSLFDNLLDLSLVALSNDPVINLQD